MVRYSHRDGIGSRGLSEISQTKRDESITMQCEKRILGRRVRETWVDKEKTIKKPVTPCAGDFLFPEDIVRKWQGGMGTNGYLKRTKRKTEDPGAL